MTERWARIDGFPDYKVSEMGRVWSLRFARFLGSKDMSRAYPYVKLYCSGIGKNGKRVFIHRLVAAAFIGPIPPGMDVNHKNGVKSDPRLENLEIVTRGENNAHAFRVLGRQRPQGSLHGCAKLTESQIPEIIQRKKSGALGRDIAREFDVSEGTISMILNRRTWTHVA